MAVGITPLVQVSFVLPCLNEIGGVAAVVREARDALRAAGVEGEVVVADSGSTDGSRVAAAEAGARVVAAPRGYGAALRAGFEAARGDIVVMADADGSYDLGSLPLFLERIASGADLVVGSRFRGGIDPDAMPWLHRYVGSPLISRVLNLLYRTSIDDSQCGMRAFRRETLGRMSLRTTGMELASEMIVNAARAGLRIGEAPVHYRARVGQSKLRALPDGLRHLRLLIAGSVRAEPARDRPA